MPTPFALRGAFLDILPTIVDHLHTFPHIGACTLACTSWRSVLQHRMFAHIRIKSDSRIASFLAILRENPKIAAWVSSARIDMQLATCIPPELVIALSSLQRLQISRHTAKEVIPTELALLDAFRTFTTVRQVDIVVAMMPLWLVTQVLMAFPNMSHCRISVVLTGGAKIKNIHEPPPTLTSITLLVGTLFCIAPLNEWFSQTRNLQNLTISYATRNQDGSECRLLKRATSLISLSITITDTYIRDDGTWVEYVYDREDDTEFRNNVDLTQNRNLRTLCLDIPSSVSLATYWLNQLPAPKLLVSLLLNLSSCAVRSVFEGPSDLVDEFDSLLGSSSFSGLKEISIIDAREGSQMLEVERNRLPLLRARNLKPFP